jgi:hypothetical protein
LPFFRFSLISEKLDVLPAFLKFLTSLLLLALTVVSCISAVAGYLLFHFLLLFPAIAGSLLLQCGLSRDPTILWFLLLQDS